MVIRLIKNKPTQHQDRHRKAHEVWTSQRILLPELLHPLLLDRGLGQFVSEGTKFARVMSSNLTFVSTLSG